MKRYRTSEAADWLAAHGRKTSGSKLAKLRMRGPDDPRDKGPDFSRDSGNVCWYDEAALERYVEDHEATLKFRERAKLHVNFTKNG